MYKMRTIALMLNSEFRFICIVVYSIPYVTLYKHFKAPSLLYVPPGAQLRAVGGGGCSRAAQQTSMGNKRSSKMNTLHENISFSAFNSF